MRVNQPHHKPFLNLGSSIYLTTVEYEGEKYDLYLTPSLSRQAHGIFIQGKEGSQNVHVYNLYDPEKFKSTAYWNNLKFREVIEKSQPLLSELIFKYEIFK